MLLIKPDGSQLDFSRFPDTLVINNLSEWKIKGKDNISGSFLINYTVTSFPPNDGEPITTNRLSLPINIKGLPDIPDLQFQNYDNDKLKIESNGWLNIDKIRPIIFSNDSDGSEEYALLIKLLNEDGTLSNINNELKFNINAD